MYQVLACQLPLHEQCPEVCTLISPAALAIYTVFTMITVISSLMTTLTFCNERRRCTSPCEENCTGGRSKDMSKLWKRPRNRERLGEKLRGEIRRKGFGSIYVTSGNDRLEVQVAPEVFFVFLHDFFFYTKINKFRRQFRTHMTALFHTILPNSSALRRSPWGN